MQKKNYRIFNWYFIEADQLRDFSETVIPSAKFCKTFMKRLPDTDSKAFRKHSHYKNGTRDRDDYLAWGYAFNNEWEEDEDCVGPYGKETPLGILIQTFGVHEDNHDIEQEKIDGKWTHIMSLLYEFSFDLFAWSDLYELIEKHGNPFELPLKFQNK